jgi:hypothetical protein
MSRALFDRILIPMLQVIYTMYFHRIETLTNVRQPRRTKHELYLSTVHTYIFYLLDE